MENPKVKGRLDLSRERYDQSTFAGRFKHFFAVCNPFTLLTSKEDLMKAKDIVMRYKNGENVGLPDEEIWRQKVLYDSAFHPVTETLITPVGRMSAQCPAGAVVMGAMMIFYKTTKEVLFWQWVNQSFNAFVNQMNSSDPRIDYKEAVKPYTMAVGLALAVSMALSKAASKMGGTAQRFVPFLSVSICNAINIPLCRQKELKEGIQLWSDGKEIAKSQKMAAYGISLVILSRIMIQAPHMLLLPGIMQKLDPVFKKVPQMSIPFQLSVCAFSLFFSTPLGCALFPHKTFVPVASLEPHVQEEIKKKSTRTEVYFNKGL